MSELLLELFSEEIPASMQRSAAAAYEKIIAQQLEKHHISYGHINSYSGPRRITIVVRDLPLTLKERYNEVKGPKVTAPQQAIEGFCRSLNITQSELTKGTKNGQEFYLYVQHIPPVEVRAILKQILPQAIGQYVWPKSMYWGERTIKWVRPLHNILCLFAGQVVEFQYGHLTANNRSYGHRFMAPAAFKVDDFADYQQQLADNYVILEAEVRQAMIHDGLQIAAKQLGGQIQNDPALEEEVAGLNEYPQVLIGKIEQRFLSVPSEILVSSMRTHQKYFSMIDANAQFMPYFVFVANIKSDNPAQIIQGNEKVLAARLADALYFYNQDIKISPLQRYQKLDKVIFHAQLGSLQQKSVRLVQLSQYLVPEDTDLHLAAKICKTDLISEVVEEFPELQGVMGYYYAQQYHNLAVAKIIQSHYQPQGPNDTVPNGAGAYLALVDKIDSLCGLISVGQLPTGSKDPFAMRRMALGIIRIILEANLDLDLSKLIKFSLNLYSAATDANQAITEQFIKERLKHYLKSNYDTSVIEALINGEQSLKLNKITTNIAALTSFLSLQAGQDLTAIYKRINNILANVVVEGEVDQSLLTKEAEQQLWQKISQQADNIAQLLSSDQYAIALQELAHLREAVDQFFIQVMVKDENPEIAQNRQLLLIKLKDIFHQLADFSKLV